MDKLSTLLIGDDEELHRFVAGLLGEVPGRFELAWVRDAAAGLTELRHGRHDVCLLDHRLGADEGLELLRQVMREGLRTPVIYVTGEADRAVDVAAMQSGAADYLERGSLDAQTLERAIRYAVEQRRLQHLLLQSERLASVGSLATAVAHAINNPLTYVIGNLDYVSSELDYFEEELGTEGLEDVQRAVREAHAGAERVRGVVRDLTTFARPGPDRLAPVQVRAALDAAIGIAQNEIRHCARLVVHYAELPAVLADESRLAQVFLNILLNATRAIAQTENPDHEIRIVTTAEEDRVVVEVRDTAAQPAGRATDAFFRPNQPGASGLGLSVSRSLLAAMQGELQVEALPEGTRVLVRLPAAVVAMPAARERGRGGTVRPRGERLRVLVVDDEPLVATTLQRILGGHEVEIATTAREALERCAKIEFDAIFCDLMMPDLTGMDFYERLAREQPGAQERIILMTGGAFTERANEFLARVPNERIEKPFDPQAVRRVLEEHIGRE